MNPRLKLGGALYKCLDMPKADYFVTMQLAEIVSIL